MRSFFVEMGQGVIFDLGVGGVRTSGLITCSFIAGKSATHAGAFHYPARALEVPVLKADVKAWLLALNPTELALIHAPELGLDRRVPDSDKNNLPYWLLMKGDAGIPMTSQTAAPAMEVLADGSMKAGPFASLSSAFQCATPNNVKDNVAGVYTDLVGNYRLIGCNRWKTSLYA